MQNDLTFIKHILDCISNINDFVKDVSYSELKNNVMLQSAILYQFMVIGEAAGNISKEFQNNHQSIPWGEMRLTLWEQEAHDYSHGSIINVPFNTKMLIQNENSPLMEFFVVKSPNPRDMKT